MKYTLDVTPRADKEIIAAVKYYNGVSAELAMRFLSEVATAYSKIAQDPQYYKYINSKGRRLRCVSLLKFPFLVVYYVKATDVLVISVRNTHRKSSYK